jgi:hypothetical protein
LEGSVGFNDTEAVSAMGSRLLNVLVKDRNDRDFRVDSFTLGNILQEHHDFAIVASLNLDIV